MVSLALGLFLSTLPLAQTGCSSDPAKVCTQSEEQSCNDKFNTCIANAAASADAVACQKCADDYCACYNACGSTCDKKQFEGRCTSGGS